MFSVKTYSFENSTLVDSRDTRLNAFICRSKSLRTPSNIFILNLAVFDLLMATEMPMLIVNSFLERMIGWETGCDVYALFGAISGMGQAISNAAIAFDRYRSVTLKL